MEELEKAKAQLEERVKFYDEQHKESVRMANLYRKQLSTLNRSISIFKASSAQMTKSDGETLKEVAEGLGS